MLIRGRRGLTRFQILLAGVLGTLGGVYIWKPLFEERLQTKEQDKKSQIQELNKELSTTNFVPSEKITTTEEVNNNKA